MKTSKHTILLASLAAVILLAAALFTGCNKENPTSNATAQPKLEKISLRLQWLHQNQFAGFYAAKEKGFFKDEGLDVTINPGGSDYNAVTLVANGSDDVGIWPADQILIAKSKGVPVTAVGKVFDRSIAAMMVKKDSGIKTPKDFEGKTVGIYYGYDTETIYLQMLKLFNVDRSKVKETSLQYDLTPFIHGDVDVWPAYVINQPLAAREAGVQVDLLTPEQFNIAYYSDMILVSDKTLKTRRDMVAKFLRASEKGWRYAIEHRDEAADIVLKYDPHLKRDHERAMMDVVAEYMKQSPHLLAMDRSVWESIEKILLDQKLIKSAPKLEDVADFEIANQ